MDDENRLVGDLGGGKRVMRNCSEINRVSEGSLLGLLTCRENHWKYR